MKGNSGNIVVASRENAHFKKTFNARVSALSRDAATQFFLCASVPLWFMNRRFYKTVTNVSADSAILDL
jgi:hypothetical protein